MQVTTIGFDIAKNVFSDPRSGCERPRFLAEEAQKETRHSHTTHLLESGADLPIVSCCSGTPT